MMKFYSSFSHSICLLIILLLVVVGCSQSATKGIEASTNIKKMPDQMTKIKFGLPSQSIDYLPWYVADKTGIFKKYNLDVEIANVDGGVLTMRGLQTGDFPISTSLPESFILGVAEGANVKMIGAITTRSMFSVFSSPDIKKTEDLRGKAVAVQSPGNGTDLIMRWWLKHYGLEPDKDVRIIDAGGNPGRMEAVKTGKAQATLLSNPSDLVAEKAGLKRLALIRDDLKDYDHACIEVNGKILKEKPEIARAFMAATAEAIEYTKNEINLREVIPIGTQALGINEEDFIKSLNFAIPSYSDKGKLNVEGIKVAIDMLKQTGQLKKEISLKDFVDENFYPQ